MTLLKENEEMQHCKTSLFPPSGQNGVAAVADSNCGQRYKTFSTVRLFCHVYVFDYLGLGWSIGHAVNKTRTHTS